MSNAKLFELDNVTRKGMDCLIEGVEYPGDSYRKCRLTMTAKGFSYRAEGDMSHAEALHLSLVLPPPGAALHLVDAAVTGERHHLPSALGAAMRCSTLKIWTLTILSCPDTAKVVQGRAYAAIDFGMRPPIEARG